MAIDEKKQTAKEMFEKCGFPLVENPPFGDWIVYGEPPLKASVIFDKTYKTTDVNVSISPEMVFAIYQQMKELGWIE